LFLLGSLEQGLIFAIMSLGVYISYKILDFPDLSVDGSFPLGASIVGASLVAGHSPFVSLVFALIGGALAGAFTGFIHTRFNISNLLAGILTMTALYSVNLRVMGKSNIHLFNIEHLFNGGTAKAIYIILILLALAKFTLDFLLKTKFGFVLRALGDNETLVSFLGVNEKTLKILGLAISNSLVAFSGGILAQYQGFADVGMGTGIIVTGLASIIVGESLLKRTKFAMTSIVIVGSLVYKLVTAFTLRMGLAASDLKLITSLIVILILALKHGKLDFIPSVLARKHRKDQKSAKGGELNA